MKDRYSYVSSYTFTASKYGMHYIIEIYNIIVMYPESDDDWHCLLTQISASPGARDIGMVGLEFDLFLLRSSSNELLE